MSGQPPDSDLDALQGGLDAAFAASRPRRGFEDELWARIQERRGWRQRLSELIAAAREVRLSPALGAVAALVVVAVVALGVIGYGLNGVHGGSSTSSAAPALDSGRAGASAAQAQGDFGKVPAARLVVPSASPLPAQSSQASGAAGSVPYYGPAQLRWAGTMPAAPLSAPVFRYAEPAVAQADGFASGLGARRTAAQPPPPVLGNYQGTNLALTVVGSSPATGKEPEFVYTPRGSEVPAGQPPPSGQQEKSAGDFLSQHSLAPTWASRVESSGPVVLYQRLFAAGGSAAPEVDAAGAPAGLQVAFTGSRVFQVAGPVPLALDSANYPLRSTADVVRAALDAPPAQTQGLLPPPLVTLTMATLVYLPVLTGGDHSYFEPAWLFTGTFTSGGAVYEKRVLVPALDPAQLT